MGESAAQRISRLRGNLKASEPGARGIERVARNQACHRLRSIVMLGTTPSVVVTDVLGDVLREGQSPFAIAAGNSFERHLFDYGGARLLDLYRKAGRLSPSECKVYDISSEVPGTSPHDLLRRKAISRRLLKLKADGHPDAPNLIIKARLPVQLVGVHHFIEPDVLVAADSARFYRPVEVKSYPDRGGKTDPADIRSACRQAAVAAVALRQAWVQITGSFPQPEKRSAT